MTPDDLRRLLDYHYWARDRMLAALDPIAPELFTRDLGGSFRSIRDTVVHILSAEWVWYTRWQGESPREPLAADRFGTVAAIRDAWRGQEARTRAFLDGLGPRGCDWTFDYRQMNGRPGRSVFSEIVQHVVNHASYHRGQVTTLLRQVGAAPPAGTDLSTFHRERTAP